MRGAINTLGIVIARTDYAEADRILTILTPDHGKIKAIAKGVRKSKSKMAGGIELFSVSEISYIVGRSEIDTLISTRLLKHYGNIVKDLDRTGLAYELLRITNKATEDSPESAYFSLLKQSLETLNDDSIDYRLADLWFNMQLLKLAGHTPNLKTDTQGQKLTAGTNYNFDIDTMSFKMNEQGSFSTDHIKFLRLGFGPNSPTALKRVSNYDKLVAHLQPTVLAMLRAFVRV